jgi:hypothetical protein
MTRMARRWFTRGVAALALGIVGGRGLQPEPARASKRKPIKYDISTSEFRSTCTQAGGEFADWGNGEATCYMDGWEMTCSKVTRVCRITCHAGVKCVSAKRLPGSTQPALSTTANQLAR